MTDSGLNLTGQLFGRLTALSLASRSSPTRKYPSGRRRWLCQCSCGSTTIVHQTSLVSGTTRSCGCLRREKLAQRATHGQSRGGNITRVFQIWRGMIQRCYNPDSHAYNLYGGAGVRVCEKWHNIEGFIEDMGMPPPGKTLDRYPNMFGDYEPSNCRWATPQEQARNRRSCVFITINDKTMTLTEWAQHYGLRAGLVRRRLSEKWPVMQALQTPPNEGKFRLITIDDVTRNVSQWSRIYGVASATIYHRLRKGWDPVLAVTTPVMPKKSGPT